MFDSDCGLLDQSPLNFHVYNYLFILREKPSVLLVQFNNLKKGWRKKRITIICQSINMFVNFFLFYFFSNF